MGIREGHRDTETDIETGPETERNRTGRLSKDEIYNMNLEIDRD